MKEGGRSKGGEVGGEKVGEESAREAEQGSGREGMWGTEMEGVSRGREIEKVGVQGGEWRREEREERVRAKQSGREAGRRWRKKVGEEVSAR